MNMVSSITRAGRLRSLAQPIYHTRVQPKCVKKPTYTVTSPSAAYPTTFQTFTLKPYSNLPNSAYVKKYFIITYSPTYNEANHCG